MKWMVVAMLMVGCGKAEVEAPAEPEAQDQESVAAAREDVTVTEFIEIHRAGVNVIDVRTQEEWDAGHVPGAIHIPIAELQPEDPRLLDAKKDGPIYFICATGGRSGRAADSMSQAGFHSVNVVGGTKGWIAQGQPVE